jgi:RecB family endonuclease NucS
MSTQPNSTSGAKQSGIRYRTSAGEIDLLCTDEDNDLVIIELKRNRAPDKVVSQLDRYIAWVVQNIAKPGQNVRGIIIARKHSEHVVYSASRHADIELWTYDLKLTLCPIEYEAALLQNGGNVPRRQRR